MERKITHLKVGNGNCSVIEADDFVMVIDLNKTEDKDSSYDLLKPFFRNKDGKDCIDVLCITHGDKDHCLDFKIFKEKIDSEDLVIGSIWHQDYDRRINENKNDLPEDYLKLQEEIDRRKECDNPEFGELQIALKAKDDEEKAFKGITKPDDFTIKVLSPFTIDDEESEYDHNDLSLIINFNISNKTIMYTGDAPGKYWQERIIPELLDNNLYKDWAKVDILEVGHHGSFDFFGEDRDSVRDSEEQPDNYESLDRIDPADLIISAQSHFPLSGDKSGEDPPHYAAWKWYHKWFRDNHDVNKEDKHPEQFKYTSEGNIRLEYDGFSWQWDTNWDYYKEQKQKELIKEAALKTANNGIVKKPWCDIK